MNISKIISRIDIRLIIGLLFIILAGIIFVTDFLDGFVTNILWPLLEGSSEGKTVIFLGLIGLIIILDAINDKLNITARFYKKDNNYQHYLLACIIILIVAALLGLVTELYIRHSLGISPFTILTAMNPYPSTSSPMHSHAYKSVLGIISYYIVPVHMNTGISILQFVQPYVYIIIPVWIVSFILGVLSLNKMRLFNKVICIVALVLALIGITDGGIYSHPFLIGIGFLLLMYFTNNQRLHIKHFIKPVVIMGYILLVAMIIEVGGSNQDVHTLTVINQTTDVDMSMYNVTDVVVNGDMTTYTLNTTMADKELITSIFEKFYGKCDATFMSWNFYSYFDNPSVNKTVHR